MERDVSSGRRRFATYAYIVLAINIPVILWGAYVRISFSGDGCGAHWPFCNGQIVPQQMARPMMIEFTHRVMTSLDWIAMVVLCIWAFRAFPRGHAVRKCASFSLILLFLEALLGAGLVLLRYVAHDQSAGRAVYLSAHLTNTLILLGALTMTARLAAKNPEHVRWQNMSPVFAGALVVTALVSITGAIAALGDTLFPASSMAAGMRQDFAATSNYLLRLRVFHPLVALSGAAYIFWAGTTALKREDSAARTAATRVIALTLLQLIAGAVNITLLAPVWMQIIHLLMADLLWIAVLMMVLETAHVSPAAHKVFAAVQ